MPDSTATNAASYTTARDTIFYLANEAEMGVIIDRLRVVNWAVEALSDIRPSAKNAANKLKELFEWSTSAINLTSPSAA